MSAEAPGPIRRLRGHLAARLRRRPDLQSRLEVSPYVAEGTLELLEHERTGTVLGYSGRRSWRDPAQALVDVFRGPESRVRDLQSVYLPLLDGREPVLDAGCGRGEFLDLARDAGLEVRGVDADPALVEQCRAKGHQVECEEVNPYLQGVPDQSLGVLFSAQMIEHLPYRDLVRFLELGARKLKPDGLLIAETVNVHLIEGFKTFWLDPTHMTQAFPETLLVLCQAAGFDSAYAFHPFGVGDFERDRLTQPTFAVVASKGDVALRASAA